MTPRTYSSGVWSPSRGSRNCARTRWSKTSQPSQSRSSSPARFSPATSSVVSNTRQNAHREMHCADVVGHSQDQPTPTPRRIRPKLLSPRVAATQEVDPNPTPASSSESNVRRVLFNADGESCSDGGGAAAVGTAVSDEEDTDARPVGGGCQASIDAQDCDTGSLPVQVMNMFADFSLCSCASRSRWFASWTLSMLSPIVMSMGDHCLSNLKRILSRDPVVRDAVHHSTFREVSLVTVCVHSFELHLLPLLS